MTPTKKGYAVQLTRKDGTKFLAHGSGVLPHVAFNRTYAVQRKRELAEHGMKGRVVEVRYTDPVVVEK